jgi:hypothetical protein
MRSWRCGSFVMNPPGRSGWRELVGSRSRFRTSRCPPPEAAEEATSKQTRRAASDAKQTEFVRFWGRSRSSCTAQSVLDKLWRRAQLYLTSSASGLTVGASHQGNGSGVSPCRWLAVDVPHSSCGSVLFGGGHAQLLAASLGVPAFPSSCGWNRHVIRWWPVSLRAACAYRRRIRLRPFPNWSCSDQREEEP